MSTGAGMATGTQPRRLVVSAVNLVEGGTLRVLQHFVREAREALPPRWEIVALVHDTRLLEVPGVRVLAHPGIKRSWLRRLWFEYVECLALSRRLQADVWLALHDITPRVQATRRAVYCHNATPFCPLSLREARQDWKLLAFRLFYGALYRINLHANDFVIVQQGWLRQEFERRYGARRVVVAHPVSDAEAGGTPGRRPARRGGRVFLYPTLPRPFKNVETLAAAVRLLEADPRWRGEVRVTIRGDENSYARALRREHGDLASLRFIGLQPRESMQRQYEEADCLVFPSLKESWGLPLTEAKSQGLAILAADLPYARESVGRHEAAGFFAPLDAAALAHRMLVFSLGEGGVDSCDAPPPAPPYAPHWRALVALLTDGL